MNTIWKYPIPLADTFPLNMPRGATPLCVDVQRGEPCLWALVDTTAPNAERTFHIVGTGQEVPRDTCYVGTFQQGPFVWHVWEGDPR
jgi:hypothetical protein